ncbi:unnamed protein product [Bursaphelenchus okinawaensis]|uniref:Invertebrate defensins family profile domain-containing protein n=1 Tax=Bursaphelenchus okinawaensis TaxID=465554 RepID=A0A811L4R5_9BILA|nr:unnamed protein product [Bursaphelenchus okinawaensis]CAG9117246.1 unnamed protein product [Bursaphelenchus okinawaensis]
MHFNCHSLLFILAFVCLANQCSAATLKPSLPVAEKVKTGNSTIGNLRDNGSGSMCLTTVDCFYSCDHFGWCYWFACVCY